MRRETDIICPSGLKGTVRALEGDELNVFANKQTAKRKKIADKLLNACWMETQDSGPAYEIAEDTPINFTKILTCDRFYALMRIRALTHGDIFSFKRRCTDTNCGKKYIHDLNLEEDLTVYDLPEASIEVFRNTNRFTTNVADNRITFKLYTGSSETDTLTAQDMAPQEIATTSILQSLVEVKPPDSEVLTEGNGIHSWLKKFPQDHIFTLLEAMEEVDGGVETKIGTECPHCGDEEDVEIPFNSGAFWAPTKHKRSTKRKARARNLASSRSSTSQT